MRRPRRFKNSDNIEASITEEAFKAGNVRKKIKVAEK
jgi:hypothetical protein